MSEVSDLEQEVRRLINEPRKRDSILKNEKHWNKLCSSMDTIGDTELAYTQYLADLDKPASKGELYYLVYGILQALYLQQDAVRHLSEALELGYENNQTLNKIRDIRNNSIGHPTQRNHGKDDTSYNFISRVTMNRSGFKLMKTYAGKKPKFINVDIPQLITEQRTVLKEVLDDVVGKLKMEEINHRKEHRDNKLIEIFPSTLHYYFEKITEGIFRETDYLELGLGVLDIVEEIIVKLKQELIARDIYEAYNFEEEVSWTEYTLRKIREYFEKIGDHKLNEKDAYIYLTFLRKQFNLLKEMSIEIDNEYESDMA
jgi:energy-converting hydrogenase A subunit M